VVVMAVFRQMVPPVQLIEVVEAAAVVLIMPQLRALVALVVAELSLLGIR
jgi:hypothetical protein